MSFVLIGDVVLHVTHLGDPSKPAIMMSNSLGTDARIWNKVAEQLLPTHRVVLYDKRGHGLSDLGPTASGIEDHAADLIGIADRYEIARFGVVGLSVGGLIGQTVAIRRPERVATLVLCDTAVKIGTAEFWNARIAAIEAGGLASIGDTIMERWFSPDYRNAEPEAMNGWRNMLVRQPAAGYVATCAAIRDADLTSGAPSIAAPTLVLVGDRDLSTPPDLVRATARLIPGARFTIVPGSSHLPCIEQPDITAEAILRHCHETGFV